MIRLHRPPIPDVLSNEAPVETAVLWDSWENHRRPDIKNAVYAHPTVKQTLKHAQHNKCAYCETRDVRSHGVVEHYRPKLGWRQAREDNLQNGPYFWLAYDWDNLLFACDMCNDAGHKQNLFPLADPAQRATAANPDIRNERPLLINPYDADPDTDIEWNTDVPRAKRASLMGM